MATVALFHSVLGLREVESVAADRMRGAGHTVITPDLYAGPAATSIDEGFELMRKVGWEAICSRALAALEPFSETAVLAGHSMGAGVVSSLWPRRVLSRGIILLHGLAEIPQNVRLGIPITVHVADPDPFAPPEEIDLWSRKAAIAGATAHVFRYPNVGHFYTDDTLPDYDQAATDETWQRVLRFLSAI